MIMQGYGSKSESTVFLFCLTMILGAFGKNDLKVHFAATSQEPPRNLPGREGSSEMDAGTRSRNLAGTPPRRVPAKWTLERKGQGRILEVPGAGSSVHFAGTPPSWGVPARFLGGSIKMDFYNIFSNSAQNRSILAKTTT